MPSGWECRAKFIKQNTAKPTVPRDGGKEKRPGPNVYEPPQIFCNNSFYIYKLGYTRSKICDLSKICSYSYSTFSQERLPPKYLQRLLYHLLPILIYVFVGGKGYDKIKRAPAYTFGHMTPVSFAKPAALPYAPQIDVQGMNKKGGMKT